MSRVLLALAMKLLTLAAESGTFSLVTADATR
jgi:hypothetical protein